MSLLLFKSLHKPLPLICEKRLRIGGLPSVADLTELRQAAFSYLINVSGIDITEVYTDHDFSFYTVSQFVFADIFSSGKLLQFDGSGGYPNMASIDEKLYLTRSTPEHRQAFLQAVIQLNSNLLNKKASYLFCHQGQGRSPTVFAASLCHLYSPPLDILHKTVLRLRPQTQLTDVSLSAIYWCCEKLRD